MHESLLTFPCDFPLKIMGRADTHFESSAQQILSRHYPDLGPGAYQYTPSRQATYLSLSVVIRPQSQVELDRLYQELTQHPDILMVL